jgi:hypothetical protein
MNLLTAIRKLWHSDRATVLTLMAKCHRKSAYGPREDTSPASASSAHAKLPPPVPASES